MNTDHDKRWTPITRPGGIYCSPGCGFNCAKEDHDEAQRKGAELAQRLGQGWEPVVWENCMWHYAARVTWDGPEVRLTHGYEPGKAREGHREGIDDYTCHLNTNPQFIGRSTDPSKAFQDAIEKMERHIAGLGEVARTLREAARKAPE